MLKLNAAIFLKGGVLLCPEYAKSVVKEAITPIG